MNFRKFLLGVVLMASFVTYAQDGKKLNIEDLHNKKWNYIVEKANFTQQEAAAVKPLFMDFEQSLWKTAEANKDFIKDFFKNKDSRTEADYEMMNTKMLNAEIQRVHMMKSYYTKLKKVLSAEKIFRYFDAERRFKRELMDSWPGKRKGGPDR